MPTQLADAGFIVASKIKFLLHLIEGEDSTLQIYNTIPGSDMCSGENEAGERHRVARGYLSRDPMWHGKQWTGPREVKV